MELDLTELYSGIKDYIDIDSTVEIDKSYYDNTDIIDLSKIKVKGSIFMDSEDNIQYDFNIKGKMVLNDSISLEEVSYPFECEISEILDKNNKNFENTLDIIPILWENIVLEVPLRFTQVNDLSKFSGDGWKIVSEEELKQKNNPFKDLD